MLSFESKYFNMNIESLREYCISKIAVTEGFPFDETTLVFKVMDKMFLLTDLEGDLSINIKCDPEKAIALREQYESVIPGFHMNKRLWNTVNIDGSIPDNILFSWIDDSYDLVVQSLTKKKQKELQDMSK